MLETIGLIFLGLIALLWFPYIMYTSKNGAPFVTMEPGVVERVMKLAAVKKGDVFYDLGSGDGRLVIAAALRGAKAYGVEIDWLRVFYSRLWIFWLRLKNAQIIRKNFFKTDLSRADIVCLYLIQETNEKIQDKLERELKKGTKVISVAFTFPGWQPIKIDPRGTIYGPIYLYKIN